MQIAPLPETGADWARTRRGTRTARQASTGISPAKGTKPEWLETAWGVSDRIARASLPSWSPWEETKLRSALSVEPADDRDTWIPYGGAIHDLPWGDRAFEVFHDWSKRGGDKYKGREDCERTWRSFDKPYNGIPATIYTIYFNARAKGWIEPSVNDSNFNGVEALPESFQTEDLSNPLIRLNQKHAVISNMGNQPVVLEFVESPIEGVGKIPTFITFKSFSDRYCNQYHTVMVKDKKGNDTQEQRELGKYWLHWAKRRTYEGIALAPDGKIPASYFNLWQGWAVEPKQGDWTRMKWHIQHVIGGNDREAYEYVVRWAAWTVQHPGEKAIAALVLRGDEGVGKGMFATALLSLFGPHGLHIHRAKHMIGFNAMLRNCLLLYADEAFWAGDKEGESTLKGLITDPSITIEQKRIDAVPWPNRLHIMMAANAEWAVPARHDARRYGVINVVNAKARDSLYFSALANELNNGGREAMLYDLLHWKLDDWHPRRIPNTAALRDQKALSMDWRDQWWSDLLQRGSLPFRVHFTGDDQTLNDVASAKILLAHAADYATNARNYNPTTLGRYLGKKGRGCFKHHSKNGEIWEFPPLHVLRSKWEKYMGGWEWDLELADWQEKTDW